jgi:hypothetical protein
MPYKFDEHDATDLSRMIRRRRPQWTHQGIMRKLQEAAERGASLGQVTTAAEKATQNKKAQTPDSILWPEHWIPDTKQPAMSGERLCGECTRKHPANEMTQQDGIWKCQACVEN